MDEKCTLNIPLYAQIIMQSNDGTPMCHIDKKKYKWYMSRGLAEVVSQNPLTIRLKFKPNGKGKSNDKYYLTKIENKCVVCGTNEELTKHHIVPYLYRRFFPDEYKKHNSHDVVLVCRNCHDEYEYYATLKKKNILQRLNISPKIKKYIADETRVSVKKAASALKNRRNIPEERKEKLEQVVMNFFKQEKITTEYIQKGCDLNVLHKDFRLKREGAEVMDRVTDIETFIIEWRKHFIQIMNPKFMPEYWNINKVEKNKNGNRNKIC